MALGTSRPHNPTLRQMNKVLRSMDLAGAMRDIGLGISLAEAESDCNYWEKIEAVVGEKWEVE